MIKAIDALDVLPVSRDSIEERILIRTSLEALDLVKDHFTVIKFKDKTNTYYALSNLNGWSTPITERQYEVFKEIFKHE